MWLLGSLAAKMKTTINDPRLLDITFAQAEISYYFMLEEDNNYFERVESMLGIRWNKEEIMEMLGSEDVQGSAGKIETIRYPLGVLLRPEIIQEIRKRFGIIMKGDSEGMSGMSHIPKDAKSMSLLDKNQFMRMVGGPAQSSTIESVDGLPNNRDAGEPFRPGPQRRLGKR